MIAAIPVGVGCSFTDVITHVSARYVNPLETVADQWLDRRAGNE